MSTRMKPLTEFPRQTRRKVRFVLFDIDETLTTGGRLTAEAYGALEDLKNAGLLTAPVTGRPAGWCDHIARMWPVDGVVGENGAFYYRYDRAARRMISHYADNEATRAANRSRLDELGRRILAEVPGAGISSDQFCREADLAIDYREDVPPLAPDDIARIVQLFEDAGARAKVSSIHVNGWFGDYDKVTMTKTFLARAFGIDPEKDNPALVFAGDSPNDAPMFDFFENAVGVANLMEFRDCLDAEPAYVTTAPAGAGFAELVRTLLDRP